MLIIQEEGDHYLDSIKVRCPDIEVRNYDHHEAHGNVKDFAPQVVFSWKCKSVCMSTQRSIISQASVKWLHIAGAGFEHLLPLPDHLTVTNSSGICSAFMAETVLGAILMWNFGFPRYIELQKNRIWQKHEWVSVSDKTALIIGVGKIGGKVAELAKALGMRVIGIKNTPSAVADVDEMVGPDDLHEVLPQADYVCVHVPLTNHTRNLIGENEFALMRSSAFLVNTARGGVVDEEALSQELINRTIAGAYMDVFTEEPLPPHSKLWDLPNLVISPHVSDLVANWQNRFIDFFVDNLKRWQAGKPLLNVVDIAKGY